MSRNLNAKVKYILLTVFMLSLATLVAVPLYYIVVSTFKNQAQMSISPLGLPESFSFQNYVEAFNSVPLARSFLNTIIVTVFAVFFQVIIGSMAAYGMILQKSKFTAAVGTILLITFAIPTQATLIPIYQTAGQLEMVNTLQGLIIIYLGSAVFCYFLIVGYMRKLPLDIIEAARIDGAGPVRIYWTIVLPLIRPILITVIIFQTLSTWNDFLWPNLFLSSSENRTIVLQVFNAVSQFTVNWPLFMTITLIALIPVIIFFVLCQKWIVSGLVAGGVKG
ncbi:carbohydrate ABC transporter permease [Actinomycetaceae bacterium TAE3-ERU4]|nr:carbohydrate ABC transporter permease [Actinomycetaceae bacterium TAE3-ERU4]